MTQTEQPVAAAMAEPSPVVSPSRQPYLVRYIVWMRFLALGYFGLAIFIFFFWSQALHLVNFVPKVFGLFEVAPDLAPGIWLAPCMSFLMTLGGLAFAASWTPRSGALLWVHVWAKVCSILGFVWLFQNQTKYFAYLFFSVWESLILFGLLWTALRFGFDRNKS